LKDGRLEMENNRTNGQLDLLDLEAAGVARTRYIKYLKGFSPYSIFRRLDHAVNYATLPYAGQLAALVAVTATDFSRVQILITT
jgi:hypothetical protein